MTKREDVTKQGFCKILWRKLRPLGMRELNKERRRQRQLHRPKKIGFLSKTKALHVHHASFTSTARLRRENLLIRRFIEVVNIQRRIFLSLYNLNKILKNSTPGKTAYLWQFERMKRRKFSFLIQRHLYCRCRGHCLSSLITACQQAMSSQYDHLSFWLDGAEFSLASPEKFVRYL